MQEADRWQSDAPPLTVAALKASGRKGGRASSEDPYWISRYIYRHVTIYFTWAAARLGLTPNVVTLISGLAMFAAALCYAAPDRWLWLVGALLVQLYFILDHVDGELARYRHQVLNRNTGMAGDYYDTCCHPGELAMMVALALRIYIDLDTPWWLLLMIVVMIFPGAIAPWQRYCETLIKYAQCRNTGQPATLPADLLHSQSLALGSSSSSFFHRAVSWITQTIGFPGYFATLPICTILDVIPQMPRLMVGNMTISYLLIWLAVRVFHSAAAVLKSMRVYGRALRELVA